MEHQLTPNATRRAEAQRKRRYALARQGGWHPETAANIAQAAYDGAAWALTNQSDWLAEADRREPDRAEVGESFARWHAFGNGALEIMGQRSRDLGRKRKARADAAEAHWQAVARATGEHPIRTEARAIGAKCWRYGSHPPKGPDGFRHAGRLIDPTLMPVAYAEWHFGYCEGRGFPHPTCPVLIKLEWELSPASRVARADREAA